MKRFGWMLIALTIALGLCAPAMAAGDGETAYRALLIGIDGYQTNALTGCANDTARMSATLQAANEAGAFYQSPTIRSNLQTDEIGQFLTEVSETWDVDEDDVTFFYFAGHGFMSEKDNPAIVGKDSTMLKIADLMTMLDRISGVKVVVLDCRYADSLLSKLSKADGTLLKALSTFDSAVIDVFRNSPTANNYYVMSSSTLSSSVEAALGAGDDPRGLITYFLTEGCGYDYVEQRPTENLPADLNGNGAVSLMEARDYIESSIIKLPNATDIVADVQIFPAGSSFPILARRATAEVLDVKLEEGPVSVPVGRTYQLEASTQPVNASKHTIYWSSSDLSIATVNDSGVVRGVKSGDALIAATTSNGITVSTEVSVREMTMVESLGLNVPRLALGLNSTAELKLTVKPAGADEPVTWKSDNQTVATVDQAGKVTCVGLGEAVISVASDGGVEASCSLSVVEPNKVVTAVELDKYKLEIFEGETRNVRSRVKPASAADPGVQFTSSDPTIADISGESIILGVKRGECIIYATASSGVSAELKVTVRGASVELNKNSLLLKEGATAELKAQVKPQSMAKPVTWESTDPSIVTVENGKLTAAGTGICSIVASLENGASATCRVMVGGTPAKNVKIKPAKVTLDAGAQKALEVEVRPVGAALESLSWKSANEKVVQVDNTGSLTAIGPGKAVVTVNTIGGGKARCLVTVKGAVASELSVTPEEATLVAGLSDKNTVELSVDAPVSAGQVDVKYQSSNPKVATVDKDGKVTAKSAGKTVIRAKAGKATASCSVTVEANRVQNKKAVYGEEELVYTSARQIYYKDGQLVVELFFANRTKSGATAPEAGTIYITLSDGTSVAFKEFTAAGKQKLPAGKTGALTYKVKVKDGDPLYGLDLRGASAQLFKPGEMPEGTFGAAADVEEASDDAQMLDDADNAEFDDADLEGDAQDDPLDGEA